MSKANLSKILPKMVSLSNNSLLTQALAGTISEKFTEKEINDFLQWMRLVEQNHNHKNKLF